MQKTANYSLPQWEAHDEVSREDFNAANAAIDGAIKSVANAAANAQRTAEIRECMIGAYTGDGAKLTDGGQDIELGFRPAFLIISRGWPTIAMPASTMMVGEHLTSGVDNFLVLTDTGFRVGQYLENTTSYPKLNVADTIYNYVAFR